MDFALYERKGDMKEQLRKKIGPTALQRKGKTYRCPLTDCTHDHDSQTFRNKASLLSHLLQRYMMPCLTCDAEDHLWKLYYSRNKAFESDEHRHATEVALKDALKNHFDAITKPNHSAVLNGCLEFAESFI